MKGVTRLVGLAGDERLVMLADQTPRRRLKHFETLLAGVLDLSAHRIIT